MPVDPVSTLSGTPTVENGPTTTDAAPAIQLAQAGGAPAQAGNVEIGRVESLSGKVFASRGGGQVELAQGAPVFQRDEIETSSDGAVGLVFLDGTKFSLGGDAKMVLDEMIYNPAAKSGSGVFSVLKGTFVFITGEVAAVAPDAMKVRTPGGTLGIRGTTVGCNVGGTESSCVLLPSEDGSEGHVVAFVSSTNEVIILDETFEAVSSGGGRVSTSKLTGAEVRALLGDSLSSNFTIYLLDKLTSTQAGPQEGTGLANNGHFFDGATFDVAGFAIQATPLGPVDLDPALLPPADFPDVHDTLIFVPPKAAMTDEDTVIMVDAGSLIAGATTPGGIPLTGVVSVASTSTAGANISFDGTTITYDPGSLFQSLHLGASATDTFAVTVQDLNGESSQITITVNIAGVNDQPTANPDAAQTSEDSTVNLTAAVLANDTDIDLGDSQTIVAASATTAGGTASVVNGQLVYDPGNTFQSLRVGESAVDTFTYTMVDGGGIAVTATVTMTIVGVNDVPVPTADAAATVEDAVVPATGDVFANDFDTDAGTTFSVVGGGVLVGQFGTLTLNVDGTFSYAVNNASLGVQSLGVGDTVADTFFYSVSDNDGAVVPSSITISVSGVNDAPVTAADVNQLAEDAAAPVGGNVLTNDSDVDQATTLAVVGGGVIAGQYGTLTLNADGTYSYTVNNALLSVQSLGVGDSVVDTFLFSVSDGDGGTTASSLSITVTGVNDAPVTTADGAVILEDTVTPSTGNVLTNDSDVDQATTLAVVGGGVIVGQYGTLMLNANGTYSYTLNNASLAVQSLAGGEIATDTFNFTVSDGDGGSTPSSVTFTVIGVNDAPVIAAPDTVEAQEDAAFTFAGAEVIQVFDVDGDSLEVTIVATNGTITLASIAGLTFTVGDGVGDTTMTFTGDTDAINAALDGLQYLGDPDFFGDATITITTGDGTTQTINIVSLDVGDVPDAVAAGARVKTNTNVTDQQLQIIITESDDDALVGFKDVVLAETGQESNVRFANDDIVTFDPALNYAIVLKYVSGSNVQVTDFEILKDPSLPAEGDNVIFDLQDQGNISLGVQGSAVDGAIWQVTGDVNGFIVGPAIEYDLTSFSGGEAVIFDTADTNTSFDLDLGLLTRDDGTNGGGLVGENLVFNDVERLDISGSNGERNTVALRAEDVLELSGPGTGDILQILGDGGATDGDTVLISDATSGAWVDGDTATAALDPVGTATLDGIMFNVFATVGGDMLYVDQDVAVAFA